MRFGDLNNKPAPAIVVRFENVVSDFGKVNEPGKAFLFSFAREDVTLILVTMLDQRKVMAWCYKWNVVYNKIIHVDSTLEIPDICESHQALYYYDTDDRVLENVNGRGAFRTEAVKWKQPLGST